MKNTRRSIEHKRLADELQKNKETALSRLQTYAAKYSFLIARTPFGFMLVPAFEGRPFKPEELEKLPSDRLEKLKQPEAKVSEEINKTLELDSITLSRRDIWTAS